MCLNKGCMFEVKKKVLFFYINSKKQKVYSPSYEWTALRAKQFGSDVFKETIK